MCHFKYTSEHIQKAGCGIFKFYTASKMNEKHTKEIWRLYNVDPNRPNTEDHRLCDPLPHKPKRTKLKDGLRVLRQQREERPRPSPPAPRLRHCLEPQTPPPSFPVAVALTERDGGGRGGRVTGHRVGKARVLPASEEPYQSKLYGAEAGRGNL